MNHSENCLIIKLLMCIFPTLSLYQQDNCSQDHSRQKKTTEDEMVGWHHQLNGHEFE